MNFWVQGLANRLREVVGERALPELGKLIRNQLQLAVAICSELAMDRLALGHLVDVLVMDRIAVLPAIGLDVGEETAIDVEQLVVGERHDRVVDRVVLAAGPEPDVRPELVGVAAVITGPGQPAHTAVLLDEGDLIALLGQVIGHRRAGHAAPRTKIFLFTLDVPWQKLQTTPDPFIFLIA